MPEDSPRWDIAFGIGLSALNDVLANALVLAPSLFNVSVDLGAGASASFVFNKPPCLTMGAPPQFLEIARAHVVELVTTDAVEQAVREMTDGSGSVTADSVDMRFGGRQYSVKLTSNIAFFADDGAFFAQLSDLALTSGEFPDALDELVAGNLQQYFNHLLKTNPVPFQLPARTYVTPVIRDESPTPYGSLVAYSGPPPLAVPPLGRDWPTRTAFVAFDQAALNTLIAPVLPHPGGSGGMSTPNLSWNYQLTLTPSLMFPPSADGPFTLSLAIGGTVGGTLHTPNGLPNLSVGASVDGSLTAEIRFDMIASGSSQALTFVMTKVLDSSSSLHFESGLPGLISKILIPVLNALNLDLAGKLFQLLMASPFKIYDFPAIAITLPGEAAPLLLVELTGCSTFAAYAVNSEPALIVSGVPAAGQK